MAWENTAEGAIKFKSSIKAKGKVNNQGSLDINANAIISYKFSKIVNMNKSFHRGSEMGVDFTQKYGCRVREI